MNTTRKATNRKPAGGARSRRAAYTLPSGFRDLTGRQFGRLAVISFSHMTKDRKSVWRCKCNCGNQTDLIGHYLCRGHRPVRSCGCLLREIVRKNNMIHGHAIGGIRSAEYTSWSGLKQRCTNKKHHGYKSYGGRGIKICKRWRNSFKNFFDDMGRKPSPKHTLDRINNDRGYFPSNCRWATAKQQGRNRRNNKKITFQGERLCLSAWAEKLSICYPTLQARLRTGWSIEKTLTCPLLRSGRVK